MFTNGIVLHLTAFQHFHKICTMRSALDKISFLLPLRPLKFPLQVSEVRMRLLRLLCSHHRRWLARGLGRGSCRWSVMGTLPRRTQCCCSSQDFLPGRILSPLHPYSRKPPPGLFLIGYPFCGVADHQGSFCRGLPAFTSLL